MINSINFPKKNYIFRLVREWQGIKQKDLAQEVKITQSALSQFEAGSATLSIKTGLDIADRLGIDLDFVEGKTRNPFKSKKLIKMFLKEQNWSMTGYPLFDIIVSSNPKVEILFLSCGLHSKSAFAPIIFAIAMRDSNSNIYLFHRKTTHAIDKGIPDIEELGYKITEHADKSFCRVDMFFMYIDEDLYDKMGRGFVKKKDIETLFNKAYKADQPINLSKAEQRLIATLREMNISPDDLTERLNSI